MTLPINHLIRILDRFYGDYEILAHTDSTREPFEATVEHLQTGNVYRCSKRKDHNWTASDAHSEFLINRLNSLARDDSGTMRTDAGVQLPADFDCVPEASDEPLKEGDWVVCVDGSGYISMQGNVFRIDEIDSPGWIRIGDRHYFDNRFRRARPDEIPQPVNINACDNPSGPCACGAWHNESDKPCDGDSFTPGKPVEQAQPLQLREGAWYQLRKGLVVGPLSPNAHGTYKWIDPKTGMNWTDAGKWWRNGQESDNDIEREVPAPSEPTTEQLTDEQVSAELKSAGIDMQPAFERLRKMFDEHKQKQPDVDGWIEWHGGEMPVDGEQLVSRRCLDVSIPSGPYLASSLRWTHVGNRYDITHYRLVQPAPKHRPFASAETVRVAELESVRLSAMVLVYQPELTHSVWQDYGGMVDDETGEEVIRSQDEMIEDLKAGVLRGDYMAWRLIRIEKEVMGNE